MKLKAMSLVLCMLLLLLVTSSLGASEPWTQYDFGGRTIDVSYTNWMHPGFDEGREKAHLEWVEEQFNVKIGFDIPFFGWPVSGTVDGLLPKVMAGESGMMFKLTDQVMQGVVAHGLLLPLDDVVDLDAYYNRLPNMLSDSTRRAGQFLGSTYAVQVGPPIPSEAQGVIWNKDLFEREGLPDLYALYEAGEWTWDALKEIAVAATRDTTGDGEIDQWGMQVRHGPPGDALGVLRLIYHNDGAWIREVDGRVVLALDEPAAIEALEFWHEIYTVLGVVGSAYFPDGNVAMSFDNPGAGGVMQGDAWADMIDDYGFVPVPKGPRADRHVATEEGKWMAALAITEEEPEAIIELYSALFRLTYPYIEDLDRWEEEYIESLARNILFRDRQSLDNFLWLTENTQPVELREIILPFPGFTAAIDDIVLGNRTAAAALAEILPSLQAHIDELFGQ